MLYYTKFLQLSEWGAKNKFIYIYVCLCMHVCACTYTNNFWRVEILDLIVIITCKLCWRCKQRPFANICKDNLLTQSYTERMILCMSSLGQGFVSVRDFSIRLTLGWSKSKKGPKRVPFLWHLNWVRELSGCIPKQQTPKQLF